MLALHPGPPLELRGCHFASEDHEVWNRPLEVGFDMEDRHIKGQEKQLEILPIFNPIWSFLSVLGLDTVDELTSVALQCNY